MIPSKYTGCTSATFARCERPSRRQKYLYQDAEKLRSKRGLEGHEFTGCGKTNVSYQGIALAMPYVSYQGIALAMP